MTPKPVYTLHTLYMYVAKTIKVPLTLPWATSMVSSGGGQWQWCTQYCPLGITTYV